MFKEEVQFQGLNLPHYHSKYKLALKVKDTEPLDENITRLRLNAARFGIRGTEEKLGKLSNANNFSILTLYKGRPRKICPSIFLKIQQTLNKISVYDFEDLLISIGGYLGLFIGVSLMDVAGFVAEYIKTIISKTVKNKQ